ncbi:MAG: ABC transporter ATP-binding protein [Clostridia bacterium]|nr:ABC transporter ATP-binding protein [Clostridia bacterium]
MSENLVQAENTIADNTSSPEKECVLKTINLTKTYAYKNVVDHVNITINKGDIYGFIGKNGAGKTTVMKMISGFLKPNSGNIELFGSENLLKGCKKIGTIIENPVFYPYMNARQNIECQCILKGVKEKSVVDELLELVGLKNAGRKKAKNFSLGMKQRLAIAIALVGDPEFLILDEPMNGLDPEGIKEIRDLILKLNNEVGVTVFISSHILGELSKMATKYGVINEGKLVAEFNADDLSKKVKPCIKLVVDNSEKAVEVIKGKFGEIDIKSDDNTVYIYENIDNFLELNSLLSEAEITVSSFTKEQGDYENYFLSLMKGEA